MAHYCTVTGWLQCPIDFDVVLEQELSFLRERYGHVEGFEAAVLSWARPVNPLELGVAYFTFAAVLRYRDIENLLTVLNQLCSLKFGLCGFFYISSFDDYLPSCVKVEADQVSQMDLPAPLYDDFIPAGPDD